MTDTPQRTRPLRVLAAMSGGVDSAVAAARAAEAGHDVTGVHLALSANPQSFRTGARGCCTIEDSRDARRAADVIGIPFYVWDLADRFRDVVEDFVAEYEAGRTRTRACAATRRSSSPRCWTRRWPSASTRSAPATTPR
ncbi:tRNA-specific 2-thiouridylase MnmA [Streptomyces canarius]